jgi:hypothetical protein
MTLHATREGQKVTIHGNIGVDLKVASSHVSEVTITEEAQHVRNFHTQLGQILDEADAERAQPEAEEPRHSGGSWD